MLKKNLIQLTYPANLLTGKKRRKKKGVIDAGQETID